MSNTTRTATNFILILALCTVSAGQALAKAKFNSAARTFLLGKSTQNVKPRYVREATRPDGSKTYVYGQQLDSNGKVTGPHGHTVMAPNGKTVYARTPGGHVIIDDNKMTQKAP